MPFVPPMLATPYDPEKHDLTKGTWYAEEKYDGHRLVVEVTEHSRDLLTPGRGVTAWSRYGIERKLPRHLIEDLALRMPNGIYDGELFVPGKRSYGVTELENSADLCYTVFDLITFDGVNLTTMPYRNRVTYIDEIRMTIGHLLDGVRLGHTVRIDSVAEMEKIRDEVWKRDGEGLILKDASSIYESRRAKTWLKIKKLQHATFRITGFTPSRGTKVNRGPYGMTNLVDADGIVTQVKTLNDKLLAAIAANPAAFIGLMLVCEYQERTPDGKYRHIRWDHLEE